jgi:hypothetical protein
MPANQQSKCGFRCIQSLHTKSVFLTCVFHSYKKTSTKSFIVALRDKNGVTQTRHEKVTGGLFVNCLFSDFPKKLNVSFPNLRSLRIESSQLKSLCRADFLNLKELVELHVTENKELSLLPCDLLDDLTSLEIIDFSNNNLQQVSVKVFKNLKRVKFASFNGNPGVTGCFDGIKNTGTFVTLCELKSDLVIREQQRQITAMREEITKLSMHGAGRESHPPTVDIMSAINEKKFADFSVIIDDHEFMVHRVVLASRSRFFARHLKDESVRHIVLSDVSTSTFKKILEFIYFDKLSAEAHGEEKWTFTEVFVAATTFQLTKLRYFALMKVIEVELNVENAVGLLEVGFKYDSIQLKVAALSQIQKRFPDFVFDKNLCNDFAKIREALDVLEKRKESESEVQ